MKRDRPYLGHRFQVEVSGMPGLAIEAGFCAVVLPDFPLGASPLEHEPSPLILRRGYCGSAELYRWWERARQGRAPKRRTVSVLLLDDAGLAPVMRWRFFDAVPLGLSYSALDALNPSAMIESIELGYSRAELG